MMSKNIQRSLPQFNIYFILLSLKLITMKFSNWYWTSKIIVLNYKRIFFCDNINKYLEVATMMRIRCNVLRFGTSLKHIFGSLFIRVILEVFH